MTDSRSDSQRNDDFRPEDLRSPAEGGPEITPEFVESTLARIQADRAEIEREAALVEEVEFPRELLDAYAVPPSSEEFTDETWKRWREERAEEDRRLDDLLHTLEVPVARHDFVSRTLDALRVERSGLRLLGAAPASRPRPDRSRFRSAWWAAAAAAVVLASGWYLASREDRTPAQTEVAFDSAQTYTPVTWATSLERLSERRQGGIRFEPVDALQLLADGSAPSEEVR